MATFLSCSRIDIEFYFYLFEVGDNINFNLGDFSLYSNQNDKIRPISDMRSLSEIQHPVSVIFSF